MAQYTITYKNPNVGHLGNVNQVEADYWDLDAGQWFDFYGSNEVIVLTVCADEVLSIQRRADPST